MNPLLKKPSACAGILRVISLGFFVYIVIVIAFFSTPKSFIF